VTPRRPLGFRPSTPRFPLTVKLLLLMIITASIPILAAVGLSLYLRQAVQIDIEHKIETTLKLAMSMEASLVDEGLVAMKQVAAAVAADPEVVATLARPDGRVSVERLSGVFARADMLLVVNRSGAVVARSTSDRTGDPFLLDGLVEQAMVNAEAMAKPTLIASVDLVNESPQIRELVDMPILSTTNSTDPRAGSQVDTALALAGVVPIVVDGRTVGAALAIDILNRDFRIVDEIANHSPSDLPINATIAMDGIRVTTNVKLKDPDGHQTRFRALGTIYSDVVMQSLRANKTYQGRALVVGEWQRTIYSPMTDFRGRVIAGPYVGIPEAYFTAVADRLLQYYQTARNVGTAALFVALAVGWWLIRSGIVSPIRRFTAQIRANDLQPPIVHSTADEIGDLAGVLDDLLRRIQDVVGRVQVVADEVNRASQALHDSAVLTSAEAAKALATATESQRATRELQEGAAQTIGRMIELTQAVTSIAEGAQRQERSVRYTGLVSGEIAGAIVDAKSIVVQASESAAALSAGARAGLKKAADLTAAATLLRQLAGENGLGVRAAELLRDPSDQLIGMATAAERLAELVRLFALEVKETEVRINSIHEEMDRVAQVCGDTAESTRQAGETATEVVRWVETLTQSAAEVARDMQSAQVTIDGIATANRHLSEMSADMKAAAERLRQAVGRFEEAK